MEGCVFLWAYLCAVRIISLKLPMSLCPDIFKKVPIALANFIFNIITCPHRENLQKSQMKVELCEWPLALKAPLRDFVF